MFTWGQLSSLSTAGGGAASPTACDFEPNSWPNLSLIEGLESDEAPNMLPPPHPDKAPATASASATRRRPARPAAIVRIISLLRIIRISFGTYSRSWHPLEKCALSRVITAQCRRTQGAKNSPCHNLKTRLAAKILMQQAEQQVVLPDPVDAEIASRQAFAVEAAFLQHPDRRRIGGNAGGLDAMEIEFPEQRWQQHAQRRGHVAAMRMGLPDPVSDGAGLHDAAADVGQRDTADHRPVRFAKYDERIGSVGGDVLGIAAQPPPETRARQIVGRPDRLPRREVFPAVFAQMHPLQEIGHLRRAQHKAVAARRQRRRSAGWQTKQGHVCTPAQIRASQAPLILKHLSEAASWPLIGSILPQKPPPCPDPCRCPARPPPDDCATTDPAPHRASIPR